MEKRRSLLKVSGLYHSYGAYQALNGFDFDLYAGEIHALSGDHRSGKTTFGRVLSGAERLQSGDIFLHGERLQNITIQKAHNLGISMVSQMQNLVLSMNAAENIFSGHTPFFISPRKKSRMEAVCKGLFEEFGVDIPTRVPLYKMKESEKHIVNICRVLSRNPKIMIIDEISANMPPQELETVFQIIRNQRDQGVGIIYITSNLNEIFKIADRVTIIKNGKRQGTERVTAIDPSRLIDMAYASSVSKNLPDTIGLYDTYQASLINELPIGEILIDNSGKVLLMNNLAKKLLHLEEHHKGKDISQILLSFVTEETHQKIIPLLRGEETVHVDRVEAFGNMLRFTISPVLNRKNHRSGTNIFIEDVSFDYQTQEYLMQAKKAASTAELAAGVAHEIKNPLAIIQNYVELLRLEQLSEDGISYMESIEKELRRITEIIGSLLSFSRVKQTPFQPLELKRVIEEILMLLDHKLSEKHIQVVKYYHVDPVINGDENKLKQLFMNLITNAIDAVLDEGIIEIVLRSDTESRKVNVGIIDNGHGIPEDIRDTIFSPFFTTKMTRTNIGLGLSICQSIVESHNGVMKFSSIPSKKTSFSIILPLVSSY